jgi:hypothetical protein
MTLLTTEKIKQIDAAMVGHMSWLNGYFLKECDFVEAMFKVNGEGIDDCKCTRTELLAWTLRQERHAGVDAEQARDLEIDYDILQFVVDEVRREIAEGVLVKHVLLWGRRGLSARLFNFLRLVYEDFDINKD